MNRYPDRIAVVTGDPSLPDPTKLGESYGEQDIEVHERMKAAFASIGRYSVAVIERHEGLFERLESERPDLVVNFCDTGYRNRPDQEIHVPATLEMLGLPYTGAPPRAMLLCYDKQIVRLVAEALGVAVPREEFVPAAAVRTTRIDEFPALVKPNTGDGSVGITARALVHDAEEAADYLGWIADRLPGRDVLIQEFLPGAEFGLGLIGNPETGLEALPMIELDFSALPPGFAPIQSFESKADPESPYWTGIGVGPAALPESQQRELAAACRTLFGRLGLRDYARFDFRTAADGSIRLMEVNPNPAWGWDAKLATMASIGGYSYAELLDSLVMTAWQRVIRGAAAG